MPPRRQASRSHEQRVAEARPSLEAFDSFAHLRNRIQLVAQIKGEWAGLPMPMDGHRLVIEKSYPFADALYEAGISQKQRDEEKAKDEALQSQYGDMKVRNRFWSFNFKQEIAVFEDADGKVRHVKVHGTHSVARIIDTLDCSWAWGIEQEANAVQTLGKMLRHHTFKCYMLTGAFMEKSQRTGLMYIFRRLRPTIVIDMNANPSRVRCTLCMHPIGYYEGTWAGAMCPSDDVIAHLSLMRGDEAMFWRRSNQHPPWRPESGL